MRSWMRTQFLGWPPVPKREGKETKEIENFQSPLDCDVINEKEEEGRILADFQIGGGCSVTT